MTFFIFETSARCAMFDSDFGRVLWLADIWMLTAPIHSIVVVVVVILFPTEYKQCITAYMNNNIKNKTT